MGSPTTTRWYYDHFVQRTFSTEMMRPVLVPNEEGELQAPEAPEEAKVLPMVRQKKGVSYACYARRYARRIAKIPQAKPVGF